MILLSVRAGDSAPGGAKRLAIDTANESRNRHSGRVLLVACVLLVLVFSRLGIRCCSARACQSLTMAGEGGLPRFFGRVVWLLCGVRTLSGIEPKSVRPITGHHLVSLVNPVASGLVDCVRCPRISARR